MFVDERGEVGKRLGEENGSRRKNEHEERWQAVRLGALKERGCGRVGGVIPLPKEEQERGQRERGEGEKHVAPEQGCDVGRVGGLREEKREQQ